MRANYMNTGIGELPKDWNIIALGNKDYFSLAVGGTPSKSQDSYWEGGTINWVRSADLTGKYLDKTEKKITRKGLDNSASKLLPVGTVVISSRVSLGNCAIAAEEVATSQDCTGIVIKNDKIYNEYLYYFIQKQSNSIKKMGEGSTIRGITQDNLEKILIPVPLVSEQRKIAEVLSAVDEAIEICGQKIQKTEKLKKGMMQKLLTRGIGHAKFKKTKLGEIPEEWEIMRIKDAVKTNELKLDEETEKNKLINYIDIESIKDNAVNSVKKFLFKDAPGRARRIIRENDIIVSTVRPYLRGFAYIDRRYDGYVCSTGFAVLTATNISLSQFIYQFVLSDFFMNQIKPLMIGSSYPAISSKDVENFYICIPSIGEQREIVKILSEIDDNKLLEKKRLDNYKTIKSGLMSELLTGRKQVKVD